jgi:RNA polymerase sigma-70 factor (ECF subfamily)
MESDLELIRRFQLGDVKAFESLVNQYQQRVANTVYSVLGRNCDVEDLAQEVFIKVYHSLKHLVLRGSFSSWLYRVTVNLCIDEIRRKKLRRFFSIETVSEDELDVHRHPPAEASAVLEGKELAQTIENAIGELKPEHRIVIVLRDVEGVSQDEMSEILNLPIGTVKSRIFRAREELRKKLEPYLEE